MPPSKAHIESLLGREITGAQFASLVAISVAVENDELPLPAHRHGEASRRRVRTALEEIMGGPQEVFSPMVYAIREHLAGQG